MAVPIEITTEDIKLVAVPNFREKISREALAKLAETVFENQIALRVLIEEVIATTSDLETRLAALESI